MEQSICSNSFLSAKTYIQNKPEFTMSQSMISQLLAPGGGIILIPFIKIIIGCLLLTCLTTFFLGVARIHMAILCFLSAGLLTSLSFFEGEYKRVQDARAAYAAGEDDEDEDNDQSQKSQPVNGKMEKTD